MFSGGFKAKALLFLAFSICLVGLTEAGRRVCRNGTCSIQQTTEYFTAPTQAAAKTPTIQDVATKAANRSTVAPAVPAPDDCNKAVTVLADELVKLRSRVDKLESTACKCPLKAEVSQSTDHSDSWQMMPESVAHHEPAEVIAAELFQAIVEHKSVATAGDHGESWDAMPSQ